MYLCWSLWSSLALGLIPHDIFPDFVAVFHAPETFFTTAFKAILRNGNSTFFYQIIIAMQGTASGFLRPHPVLKSMGWAVSSTPRDVWRERSIMPFVEWPLTYTPITSLVMVGLCFSITSPLVLPVTWGATAMLSMAQKFSLFYIEMPEYDTNGMCFRRALDHLFLGLYVMEVLLCLAIVALSPPKLALHPYIAIVVVVLAFVGTASFQMWSWRHLEFVLLKQQDEMPEENPNNVVEPEDLLPGPRSLVDLSSREGGILVDNAYKHPGLKVRKATVWIPRDFAGISDDEILIAGGEMFTTERPGINGEMEKMYHVQISNDGAAIGYKGQSIIAKLPPDYNEYDEIEM